MKFILKILTMVAAVVTTAVLFTTCKQFRDDPEDFLSYWAAEAVIDRNIVISPDPSYAPGSSIPCVPSAGPVTVTMKVHNPKNFTFIMPNSPGAPSDIVRFGDDKVKGSLGAKPVYGTDYTLEPISDGKELKLTYTAAFLKANERSSANIGASIRLYSTNGKKFNRTYSFALEANTPPPVPASVEASDDNHIALFKTAAADSDGKHYYVLCFKVAGFAEPGAPDLHSDLTHVYVSKNGGDETAYPVTLNSAHTDFDSTHSGGNFIAQTAVDKLLPAEAEDFPNSGSPQPDEIPSGPWVLYLKTDVQVGDAGAKYGIRLFDGKFYSEPAEQTIGLPAPKVFPDPNMNNMAVSGVYTEEGATNASDDLNGGGTYDGSDANNEAIHVYSAYGKAVKLTIKKDGGTDYPEGFTVMGSAEKLPGDAVLGSPSFTQGRNASVTLPAPAEGGDEAVYKVSFKVSGAGFADSIERTLYYKVRREVRAVDSSLPMWWLILKKAIEHTRIGGTVAVNGEIKATKDAGNSGEIIIDKELRIRSTGRAVINANKDAGGKPGHRIFKVTAGTLNLEKLELKDGMLLAGENGGGMFIDSGTTVNLDECNIIGCEADGSGGAIYARGAIVNMTDCTLTGNKAKDGGAVYAVKSAAKKSVVTISRCTIGGTEVEEANTASGTGTYEGYGGGIYVGSGCELTLEDCTVQGNKAKKGGGLCVYGSDSKLTLKNSTIGGMGEGEANTASGTGPYEGDGGGIYVGLDCELTLEDCTVQGNKAKKGGGISGYGTVEIKGTSKILNNEATESGGGIYSGKVLTVSSDNAEIKGNKATGTSGKGGGVYNESTAEFHFGGGTIGGNTAAKGSGVYVRPFQVQGKMTMSGSATVTEGNDVYLEKAEPGYNAANIIVTNALTETPAARLTPGKYDTDFIVVWGSSGHKLTDDDIAKFPITPQTSQNWTTELIQSGNNHLKLERTP